CLLTTGSLSDHLGRRPVVCAGLLILSVSVVACWQAQSVGPLITARAVQGIGAGLLMSALSAYIVDLEPPDRPGDGALANSVIPLAGLGAGGLIAGLILDLSDDHAPLLMFGSLTGAFIGLAVLLWLLPETA